ncbi:MAG: SprB repeat-containing protein, partial [Bacteroidia bacterium]|nr:SprB repeat-containing protein [Bacteroidia bacterium]
MKKALLILLTITSLNVFADCPGLSVQFFMNPATCSNSCNGHGYVSVTGGSGNYSYSFTNASYTPVANQVADSVYGLCGGAYYVIVNDITNACIDTTAFNITAPPTLAVTTNGSINACMGQTVTFFATGTGGTPPYQYLWSPTVGVSNPSSPNPLVIAQNTMTYVVTITDANGCTSTNPLTLLVDPMPNINIASNNATCNQCNGSIINNTTGAVTYNWSGPMGFTSTIQNPVNLCVGSYTLTAVSSTGCAANDFVNVSSNNTITGSVSVGANASCFGSCDGVLTAIPSGGTAPYTYAWSNGVTTATATNLCAGTYNVQITDANGCTANLVGTINQPTQIAINPSSSPATCGMCDGAIMTNITGGVPPYTYSWTPTLPSFPQHSNVCVGTYTVAVTDANGCLQTAVATVSNSTGIVVTQNTTPSSACVGACTGSATIIQSGGVAPYTYSLNGGSPQTSNIFTGLCAGSYVAAVTDNNGCIGYSTFFINATSIPGLNVTSQVTNESGAGLQNGS